jgi:uncharacterized membrane protein
LLFALVFVAWAVFRAYNPEIAGTEKPMEFTFINGVLGSRFFPPQDPWLSGYAISYYYFGYIMLGLFIRITGVDPAVGFNLGVALWYALVMVGAFGVVYELVMIGRRPTDDGQQTTDDDPSHLTQHLHLHLRRSAAQVQVSRITSYGLRLVRAQRSLPGSLHALLHCQPLFPILPWRLSGLAGDRCLRDAAS